MYQCDGSLEGISDCRCRADSATSYLISVMIFIIIYCVVAIVYSTLFYAIVVVNKDEYNTCT